MATTTGVKQVVGSVLVAVLAQPIHEFGHAVALRASTGVWPRIGVMSVQPLAPVATKASALTVLAAGDFAVIAWWALVFVWAGRCRHRDWAIVGITFVVLVVLLQWLTAATLFPFGRANVGGSDAAKFLDITGLHAWTAATAVSVAVAVIGTAMTLLARTSLIRAPGGQRLTRSTKHLAH